MIPYKYYKGTWFAECLFFSIANQKLYNVNLAKILFSDNSIENLIFMNYDNISEEVDGTDYKAISSIVSAGEIWEETNSPY